MRTYRDLFDRIRGNGWKLTIDSNSVDTYLYLRCESEDGKRETEIERALNNEAEDLMYIDALNFELDYMVHHLETFLAKESQAA